MKLRFTPRATQDLLGISDYIYQHNPNALPRVRAAIFDSLKTLVLFPEFGRRQKLPGVRKLVTRRYSYIIYYRIEQTGDELVVLTVQHHAQEREHEDI
jgi:toxin ParE1/3/4